MVAKAEMVCIALRYDTTMSHAFLRALGASRTRRRRAREKQPPSAEQQRYKGMLWCFRNPTSPMDWH